MTDVTVHADVRQIETVLFLLLVFVVAFGTLARRLRMAYPIILVIAGLAVSFVPGLPKISLNPDIVFLAILPPLLFHAAWQTSWREFHYNLASILMLAFGLVGFTVLGVGLASGTIFSLLTWQSGIVLGAIVAPTDAIAATSIARRVGLPERVTHVLEGESLVNDATGLLALEFGIALVVSGHSPTWDAGLWRMTWLITGGIGIGVVVGWLVHRFELLIDDGPIEMTVILITPFAAYFAAVEAHASGVLAVVACGLYLGRHSSEFYSPGVRLQASALWTALDFILNGLVFILIGLQLPVVLAGLHKYSFKFLLLYASSFSALVIILRIMWVYPGAYAAYWIRIRILKQNETLPSKKALFVVGWTGMRGVVSLAAALSLPETMANGQAFTNRNLIVFLTFSVILVTLVLQGLSLPPLIRALGLVRKSEQDFEEEEARRLMIEAAIAYIRDTQSNENSDDPHLARMFDTLLEHHRERLKILQHKHEKNAWSDGFTRYTRISHELLRIERQTALTLRSDGRINDVVLRRLERELDLSETRINAT
ncbi:Na+/H+ antiporter [Caballeronia sp. 15715]|uniref:Na+/H+ antiporter n=1 Tax=Caballeronia sp. 15715 TaxID=3391030 RepID=UPI0039E6679B